MKILTSVLLCLLSVSAMTQTVSAETDIQTSIDAVCEKINVCGVEQIKAQGLAPQMEQVMMMLLEGACDSYVRPYMDAVGNADLEDKAKGCIDSIIDKSCNEIMARQENGSTQCKEFIAAADAAGVAKPDLTQ